jgi:hypothetical protein
VRCWRVYDWYDLRWRSTGHGVRLANHPGVRRIGVISLSGLRSEEMTYDIFLFFNTQDQRLFTTLHKSLAHVSLAFASNVKSSTKTSSREGPGRPASLLSTRRTEL